MAAGDVRLRARHELEQLGPSVESASFIVDDRPPGGWDSLVTHDHLRAELAELRAEVTELRADVRVEMAHLASELRNEMRDQTRWLTGVLVVALTFVAGVARFV